ncbi:MAG: hypothetical protein JW888_06710, partial [Pirellulales bacterium]|nr:hypothetical protein [Pirellulales bacterium]
KELECITSIEQSSPLLGGGKYLSVLVERKAGGSNALVSTAIDRQLALTGQVDLTKPHVISLNLRLDALNHFTDAKDRLSICTRNVPQAAFSLSESASSGWHICICGAPSHYAKFARSQHWAFLQRDEQGRLIAVDSGITPQAGETYSFKILVDPGARQWTPSIAVNGGKWTTFNSIGMRSPGTAEENGYWPFLHFYCQLRGGNEGESVEKVGFSLDSVRITPARKLDVGVGVNNS